MLALALLGACGEDVKDVPASECASQKKWVGDNEGSAQMHPGRDCVGCHRSEGEGPGFTLAGTVFGAAAQSDDCFGASSAAVEITDASGKVLTLQANEAGNFYTSEGIQTPYTARVRVGARVSEMKTPQIDGSCNTCHTRDGRGNGSDAPGRIIVPL